MTSPDAIKTTVNETIGDILDLDDANAITADTVASDFDQWDSLAHVRIMMSLERKFKFQWSDEEIKSLKKVGDIYAMIEQKGG